MKIVHVQIKPQMSGVQRISYDILANLNDGKHELYLICGSLSEQSTEFVEKFTSIGVTIIEVPFLKRQIGKHDWYAFQQLRKIFKYYKFDIVHTNSTKPGILARIAARLVGCKNIIHTVHGIAFHQHVKFFQRIIFYFVEIFSVLFGHKNIVVNNYYKKFYPFGSTSTIYNGVDFTLLSPCVIKKKEVHKSIHFAFFARLDEQKNPLEFIEAIYLLSKCSDISNDRFSIAGDGELMEECKTLISKYCLEEKVKLIGWVKDKNSFLNDVDVLCQPSKWEAFGLVFVEAAYFSIPAIAKRVEGIPEVVKNNETGLLYDGGAYELMGLMLKLKEDRTLCKLLGYNARKFVIKNFSLDKMVLAYKKIYFK